MKYSKQRELIHNTVLESYSHPTADMVYESVRKINPNISLGTVYRNLNLLANKNIIKKIAVPNGSVHFDKNTTEHYHMVCDKCGNMTDCPINPIGDISETIKLQTGFKMQSFHLLITGICVDCDLINNSNELK